MEISKVFALQSRQAPQNFAEIQTKILLCYNNVKQVPLL